MDFLSQCTSGGCGAKIGPNELAGFLKNLPKSSDEKLLVAFDTSDDAAIYQVSEELALISTVDFFSPMVEDPRTFGRIAAANAMSDVYAMGGQVLFALNLVCFPEKMDKQKLSEMLIGGAEKLEEANASLAGGHSIYDHEPKYGLAVTGQVDPQKIIHNNTPKIGDVLIITKALGVGMIQSAVRGGLACKESEAAAIASMERLNKYAAEKMRDFPVHACTDVTGFGLLVHALEMAGDNVTLIIDTEQLPLLPQAYYYAEEFLATAAGQRNRQYIGSKVDLNTVSPAFQEILFDPQTSGGLLISVAAEKALECLKAIQKNDPVAAIIGEVYKKESNRPIILV
ncbi:selenide, water dikinase [Enterococcus haemoperoxidus ATCC BAA-382]|uniref:Selenide, water dikinase n=1 Tax=Enterococcus haemoperoxidus ATCC BAA-382 TaxID=1158608 RepID=R2SH39_9ENTE|nr:selenide, water dikinase SelD [Enterococcus haemoperoxidus]EOH92196.1 selenide, water dikinase [Enterococcus haemoperoxidus ATCC BAA-382]EOT61881.1 selenide, water dikinase [Enterococcus haemoperoxidus ATCC BAA-382]OJG54209.1 selenide, water dikinase [Enterococcus haemoperoxidus]